MVQVEAQRIIRYIYIFVNLIKFLSLLHVESLFETFIFIFILTPGRAHATGVPTNNRDATFYLFMPDLRDTCMIPFFSSQNYLLHQTLKYTLTIPLK